jgi:hypothetical protein
MAYNAYRRDPLLIMRERAAAHFGELGGTDFNKVTRNVQLSLGGPDEASTLPAILLDRDAGSLLIPDDDGDDTTAFGRYQSRYQA